jgi:hypothetical protein
MFVAVVEGLHTALRIFVILKIFNTTNSKKTPPYSAGSFNFAGPTHHQPYIPILDTLRYSICVAYIGWLPCFQTGISRKTIELNS